jgi:membrane protease YdiL (CAAX protease family)
MVLLPASGFGLGTLIGLSGNAVFAPISELNLRATGPEPTVAADDGDVTAGTGRPGPLGTQPSTVGVTAAFLLFLLVLFPWLAYTEERVFREGLETASTARQAWAALKFGLVHLLMLIPVAAALAIAVAGFVYGRVYRRAYRRSSARTETVAGPFAVPLAVAPTVAAARSHAVLASTVWHTTFNSLIVLLVLLGLAAETLLAS